MVSILLRWYHLRTHSSHWLCSYNPFHAYLLHSFLIMHHSWSFYHSSAACHHFSNSCLQWWHRLRLLYSPEWRSQLRKTHPSSDRFQLSLLVSFNAISSWRQKQTFIEVPDTLILSRTVWERCNYLVHSWILYSFS